MCRWTRGRSAGGIAARVKARVGPGPAYLTFDIDALDPAFAPGTGTPVAGGLSSAQALAALWAMADIDWCGMDVVEVNPMRDGSTRTEQTAIRLLIDTLGAAFH